MTIKAGDTVTLTGTSTFRDTLIIKSGAILNSNSLTPGVGHILRSATATIIAVVINDGVLGSSGAEYGISLQPGTGPGLRITGTGYTRIARFLPRAGVATAQTITIDQDMILLSNLVAMSAYGNSSSCTTTENCTLTINSGKTVTISAGYFHSSSSGTANPGGQYTYNINGTLDISSSPVTSYILPFSTNTSSTVTININGKIKSGAGWVMTNSGSSFGALTTNINSGGVFDATATSTLTAGAASNSGFFVINGGIMKRYAGSSPLTFPVGTSTTSYNPVIMTNSGVADTFTVSVKNTFDYSLPAPNDVVNKQWTLQEAGIGAVVSVQLGWQPAAHASNFSVDSAVNIMRYSDTGWRNYQSFMTGNGTLSDPYIAVLGTSLTSFGAIGVTNYNLSPQQPAFPGAEGGGRFTSGGRGGAVYYVTSLNDSGPGSLRDAVSQPGRTVLFKVSGTIHLNSRINIDKDNITIAGQTAPGDGICLADNNLTIKANNVIVRYLRCRMGDKDSISNDAMSLHSFQHHTIVDHCSISWSTDEAGSFYACKNTTVQWCMLYESLYNSFHSGGNPHGFGGIWGGQMASFHHNLLAHHYSRNPRFSGSALTGESAKEIVDFRNNVIYNWGSGGTYGGHGGHMNMVNNYYKAGPATKGNTTTASSTNNRNRILTYSTYSSTTPGDTLWGGKFYIDGNYVYGFPDATADNWTYGVHPDAHPKADSLMADARQSVPYPFEYISTQSATDAFISVTDSAGALLPRRDTTDRRIIRETKTGTATFEGPTYGAVNLPGVTHPSGIIDSQDSLEQWSPTQRGWPILSSTTAPDDTDNDGMPDWWETRYNLTISDASDRNTIASNGYTNLENYLNAIPSPDKNVQFTSLSGTAINDTVNRLAFEIDWAKDLFQFGLYKSADSIHFTKIEIKNTDINEYEYIMDDSAATGTTYYKIGSYKITGATDTVFSNIIKVESPDGMMAQPGRMLTGRSDANETEAGGIKIYPNPSHGRITILHGKLEPGTMIEVFTANGRKVKQYFVPSGEITSEINMTGHASGNYFLVCVPPSGEKKTVKFIIR